MALPSRQIVFRYVRLDPKERSIDPAKRSFFTRK